MNLKLIAAAAALSSGLGLSTTASALNVTAGSSATVSGTSGLAAAGTTITGDYVAWGSDGIIDRLGSTALGSDNGVASTTFTFTQNVTSFGGFLDLNFTGVPAVGNYNTSSQSGSVTFTIFNGATSLGNYCITGYLGFSECTNSLSASDSLGASSFKNTGNKGSFDFYGESFNKVVIEYRGAYDNETYGVNALKVTVAAVPEPETYAMMLAGLGAIGFLARRRRIG